MAMLAPMVEIQEPWTPPQATERIRHIASGSFDLSYKRHAQDQLSDRDLIAGDLLYLLRNGFVYNQPAEATKKPYWKYEMQCRTPNSKNREVRAVVIPDWKRKGIKLVTVMWADEPMIKK
jgi:hypothetical protein